MDRLPSDITRDIFSRVPIKYLARSRCVSKVWCKYIDDPYLVILYDKRVVEPTPILYHPSMSHKILCFHVIESKQPGTTHYVLEPKEGPFFRYSHTEACYLYSRLKIKVQGSCNGLMCLSEDVGDDITSLAVVHPLRKEYYELPRFPLCFYGKKSCGLGFDASTNTWKMVCVNKHSTMVHVFGTNSWREIPQVPSYQITGKAVFANGCLHWLAKYSDTEKDCGRHVIWFDVNKEEFGLIERPKTMCPEWIHYTYEYAQVVDLNGEVGYVCTKTMEFWLLNHKKEWVPHCPFKEEIVPEGYIDVIGCLNKDEDILIRSIGLNPLYAFYVYNLKSGVLHKTNLAGSNACPDIIMYRNTLSSIHDLYTNSFSMKTIDLKKSCRDLHDYLT